MTGKMNLFLSNQEIQRLNAELAERINRDYPPNSDITVIVTLKGAMLFAADLVRLLRHNVKLDFVRLASYGSGTTSSGRVQILKDIELPPEGKHLLILDEIVDTGRSLAFLEHRFADSGAASVKFCALLDKASRREVPVDVHYVGRVVEDKFLVGYGLDHAEAHRHLPDIYDIST